MESFTSASLDRKQCFNLRHQPIHLHDLSSRTQRLRIGPTNLTVDLIQQLPEALESLEWDMGHEAAVDENALRELFKMPHLKHLSFHFRNSDVIQSLKRCLPCATKLIGLDLRNNLIGDEGIADLVESLLQTNLKSLKLGLNRITDVGAKSLAQLVSHPNCQLTHLDLNCNLIGNSGGCALAKSLKENTTLKTFVLYGNAQLSCGRDFVECLQFNSSISDWNLQRTQIKAFEVSLIKYWLMLNKCGRKILKDDKLPSGLWPHFLEKHASREQDALFYFLSQKPDLIQKYRPIWKKWRSQTKSHDVDKPYQVGTK